MTAPSSPAGPAPTVTGAAQVHQVIVRLFAAVESGDIDAYLDATYHPDVTIHEPPALPYGGDYHGPAGVLAHAVAFTTTWAPYRAAAEQAMGAEIDAVPDHGYVRWTLVVAGRRFEVLSHYRFRDGLIVESRMYPFDAAALLLWWQHLTAGSDSRAEQAAD